MFECLHIKCRKACQGKGQIPLVKEGRVIPHTFVFCPDCYEPDNDYRPPAPEDFDFPISYDVYRALCQTHGWTDPGAIESKPVARDTIIIERQPANLEHIQGELNYLTNKINGHIDSSKNKKRKEAF